MENEDDKREGRESQSGVTVLSETTRRTGQWMCGHRMGYRLQAGVHCGSCKGYWPKRETPALLRNPNDLPVR